MSGLLFFSANDFHLEKGSKGSIICHEVPGISLILFYSTQCKFCHTLIPIFKRLPGTLQGCQFGMINVSKNRKVIDMSKQTISPITYVPYIILFVNGKPFMRYDGPPESKTILEFVIEVSSQIQSKQQFVNNPTTNNENATIKKGNKREIPSYCVGNPLYGDDNVCYLEFDDAYEKERR